ncbi:probable short-chain alcohol dehydrogenase of unknown specificity [Cephalotrichum gorgonifer]|uniref:Adh_short domain-containing protein n=1 Tax=Cephalotrichum gorgonifer TaxID=2041049 RepID=A0AAE8N5Z9_9PEZI|nr:probable short-chain alcohol dehydrogenase of unknown specificity [Cephalotrichum gorgonifer]
MALQGKVVVLTGASMGIGEAIASQLAEAGAYLVLLSRSEVNTRSLGVEMTPKSVPKLPMRPKYKAVYKAVDIGDYDAVDRAIASSVEEFGQIDILVNNAGLALGAPAPFADLKISDVVTMNNTNVNGLMFVTHSVLNRSMLSRGAGTILNITSVTGLEPPPFRGEAVYHANKACQEAFTNSLRNELSGTNIRVLALRPGCVATNFHSLRVGHDKDLYESFFEGFDPLVSKDIADSALFMLSQPLNISIKAMDVVPSGEPPSRVIGY